MVKNLLIIIGGNRVGNYETFAPIVNELKSSCNYQTLTVFQSKDLLEKVSRNKILSNVYLNQHSEYLDSGGFSLFHNAKLFFNFKLFCIFAWNNNNTK